MMQLVHGGDWAGYRAQYGQDALDFSANVSPLGLPEGVAKAITAALATADRYPDPLCRALRAKLAVHETVPAAHILCGNGAADLISGWCGRQSPAPRCCPPLPLRSMPPRWKPRAAPSGGISCEKAKILQ